jgi:hypothetical protein
MSVDVTTADLRAARTTLQRLASDTDRADAYKADYLKITTGDAGAFFQHVDNVNSQVVSRLGRRWPRGRPR